MKTMPTVMIGKGRWSLCEQLISYFAKVWGAIRNHQTITDSTVWREDYHTRLVWITMLAMPDAKGFAYANGITRCPW